MYKYNTCTDEMGHSEGNDDAPSQGIHTTDKPVRLLDSDPLVLHALPSTVSADGKHCNVNISAVHVS